MSLDIGFNFRATVAFATDPAGTFSSTATAPNSTAIPQYPTTDGGATYGWVDAPDEDQIIFRDRAAGNIHILRGHQRTGVGAAPVRWRVDLPNAGDYEIHYASGDATYAMAAGGLIRILDDTSVLAADSIGSTSAANHFRDASGVERTSDTDWESNEVGVVYTFATTTMWFEIGGLSTGASTILVHFRVVEVAPPTEINANSVAMTLATFPATISAPGAPAATVTEQPQGAGSGRWEPALDEEKLVLGIIQEFLEKVA